MKITTFIIFAVILQVSAAGFAQKVTLSSNNSRLTEVFNEIRNQTGYDFLFTSETLKDAKRVSIKVENAELKDVLNQLFTNQPLEYIINKKAVIVSKKETPSFLDRVVDAFTPPVDVRGVVVDEKGMPLPGANVKVKGFKQAAMTDNEGRFYLPGVDDKAVLIVSFVGYKDVEVGVKASLSIVMEMKSAELDEVVVAYGKTTQQALTGSVTVVKGEQLQNQPYRSVDKALQGLVPGLFVTQGTGQPGGGVSNFVLRGIATGASPDNGGFFSVRNPLIVIDGIPVSQEPIQIGGGPIATNNPLAQLNTSDVESITVLKDAAAIALYGSRASNGVILITTKKGKSGKTQFSFRHQTDISTRLNDNQRMLNHEEYLELLYETYRNTDPVRWTDDSITADLKTKFPTKSDGSFYVPSSDWLNELYDRYASTITNEISVSGGNDKQNFYLNVEYTKQNGIEKSSGFDRKSIRFNYENRPASWFKLGLNSTLSYTMQNYGSGFAETAVSRMSPLNPIKDETGNYIDNYSWGVAYSYLMDENVNLFNSPIVSQIHNINKSLSFRGLSKLHGEAKFLKYFSFVPSLGIDFVLTESKVKIHPRLSINNTIGKGQLYGYNNRAAGFISTNILKFDRMFSSYHNLNILVGHEAQILSNNSIQVARTDLMSNPQTEQLIMGSLLDGGGLSTEQTLLSYFGQLNYNIRDRYFISTSIRSDGSSLFGDNKRFGTHWSSGVGWILSSEPFLKSTNNFISFLKIRGSVGSAGNSAGIRNTLRYHQLYLSYYLNGPSLYPDRSAPGNPNIKWEKTTSWNFGVDLKVLKNRIAITTDYYFRRTTDLLGMIQVASATGYSSLRSNIGDLNNKGIELSISTDLIKYKEFRWSINFNLSMNKNKLIKSSYPLETADGLSNFVNSSTIVANGQGENYNSFYLVKWAGVDPATGKPQWIDSLGNANSNYAAAKPFFVGKPQPDGFGSFAQTFSWKNLELSMMLNYQYGFKVYQSYLIDDGLDPYINQGNAALNRWQKAGDIATNPRRLLFGSVNGMPDNGYQHSTRYLLDGDFVRLSNVTLSYLLPQKTITRLHLNSCRVFVQANNLGLWTKYSGRQDPENVNALGTSFNVYPLQRSYSIGLNLNF